ncbi:hypothetical protein A0U40_16690 [[Bacillus] sp. KCTC 13219]|nr:hypothetical protein A0U40_16690 [[Bacillus] sp. KCTC 13219]
MKNYTPYIFLLATIPRSYLAIATEAPAKHYFFVLAIWFIYMFLKLKKGDNRKAGMLDMLIAFLPLFSYPLFHIFSAYSAVLTAPLLALIALASIS